MQALTAPEFLARNYRTVVFAGGGNRCWWQAGLIEVLAQHPCWKAQRLIGASAGAGIATAFVTGRTRAALAAAAERFAANQRNFDWAALLRGRRPFMMPRIYPLWIHSFLDAAGLARLQQAALTVEVVITRPIAHLPVTLSTLLALALYASEKYWLKNFHARLPHRLGFRAEYLDLATCADLDEAHRWLLASAAAVPITPVLHVRGCPALDGGFYDSIPLPQARSLDPETLVLLTRHRPDLPQIFSYQQRVYAQPKVKVAAINMDCTNGHNLHLTFEQGRQEALALLG